MPGDQIVPPAQDRAVSHRRELKLRHFPGGSQRGGRARAWSRMALNAVSPRLRRIVSRRSSTSFRDTVRRAPLRSRAKPRFSSSRRGSEARVHHRLERRSLFGVGNAPVRLVAGRAGIVGFEFSTLDPGYAGYQ